MNLQSILLIGMLLGNSVATDTYHYENVYMQDYEQKQEQMYIEKVEKNPNDIEALTELANYYEDLWKSTQDIKNLYKAEVVYKDIIKVNPKSTALSKFYLTVEYKLNSSYIKKIDDFYKKSEEECLRLLAIDNDNIEIMFDLGALYSEAYYFSVYLNGRFDDNLDLFNNAEKLYFYVLDIDENNIYVRYRLTELYGHEWLSYRYEENVDNNKYFDKIEQQYLEILNVDDDYIQARYDLIDFYNESYLYKDKNLDCMGKAEEQFAEILKRETKNHNTIDPFTPIWIGTSFESDFDDSNYTDIDAFEKAEYYYKYALSIEPDNSLAQYKLCKIYENGYYYGNLNNEENFKNLEQIYKKYSQNLENDHDKNVYSDLATLYKSR